jgi:hypothetical protein
MHATFNTERGVRTALQHQMMHDIEHAHANQLVDCGVFSHQLWFAKTLANFEINDIAALPPMFCYNS